MIQPTIGRNVWYHPHSSTSHVQTRLDEQPHDATVIYVHDARTVNLRATDHVGNTYFVERAPILQEGDQPLDLGYAEWPVKS